jgi:hypothetical protein
MNQNYVFSLVELLHIGFGESFSKAPPIEMVVL